MSISANPTLAETDQQERSDTLMGLINAALDALTGDTVVHLTKSATDLFTLLNRFSSAEVQGLLDAVLSNAEALTETINTLGNLVENGSLTRIVELLDFVRAILDSANAALVSSVTARAVDLGLLADRVADSPLIKLVPGALDAMELAYRQVNETHSGVKLGEVFKLARDPKTLATLKFLLLFLQGMESRLR